MRCCVLFALLVASLAANPAVAAAAPDVLVVCPAEFRAALAPWAAYRRSQGHELLVIQPPATAAEVQTAVRRVAASGRLKYLVLVGDVPSAAKTYATTPDHGADAICTGEGQYAVGLRAVDCHRPGVCRHERRSGARPGGWSDPGRFSRRVGRGGAESAEIRTAG